MNRPKLRKETLDVVMEMVRKQVERRLEEKGDGAIASRHEYLGIVQEEHNEFIQAVTSEEDTRVVLEGLDVVVGHILGIASITDGARLVIKLYEAVPQPT